MNQNQLNNKHQWCYWMQTKEWQRWGDMENDNGVSATLKNESTAQVNLCMIRTENTRQTTKKSANVNKSVALKSNKFQHCHAIHSSCALLCMAIKDSCASVRMLNTPVLLTTVQFIAFFSQIYLSDAFTVKCSLCRMAKQWQRHCNWMKRQKQIGFFVVIVRMKIN